MSKQVSAGFLAHLDQETTELTTCIYLRRQDGTEYRFAEFDTDVVLTGGIADSRGRIMDGTYVAAKGQSPTGIDGSGAMNVDNMNVMVALDNAAITEADMTSGLWDYADFNFFHVVHSDISLGVMWLMSGKLGEVKMTRDTGVGDVELRSKAVFLQETIGRVVTHECPVDLGDHECNVLYAVADWAGSTAYTVGDRVRGTVKERIDYVCTTAGTSGTAEPVWNSSIDATTADNTATWTAYPPLVPSEWVANRVYALGDIVTATTFDKRRYVCTTAGTAGGSEPSWNTTIDGTTADNTAVWTAAVAVGWYGTITGVTDNAQFADSALIDAGAGVTADWFKYGLLTWLTGLNAGIRTEVKTSDETTGELTVWSYAPYTVQIGDTFVVEAGCDKARQTCEDKFANVVNFRGFPWVPGRDALVQTPGSAR